MKIAHLSDTHLGYRGQGIPNPAPVTNPWKPATPINQWELDLMLGLSHAIDAIIEKVEPDLVLHTGDLFDSPRPTPLYVDFAMTQFKRLRDAEIPVVLVEGARSYPRDHSRGHVIQLLSHLGGITVFCERDGQVRVGDAVVHAVPYVAAALGSIPKLDGLGAATYHILTAHAVADGLPYFRGYKPGADFGVKACASSYNYVALGHYHRFAQIPKTDCAFYAGSTAMVTWGDLRPRYAFGFNVAELSQSSPPTVRREIVPTRPMHTYGLENAEGLSAIQVLEFLSHQAEASPPDGAYCQVIVQGMEAHARRELDMRTVDDLFAGATYLSRSFQPRTQRWDAVHAQVQDGGTPKERYTRLVVGMGLEQTIAADVLGLGLNVLERAEALVAAEESNGQEDGE